MSTNENGTVKEKSRLFIAIPFDEIHLLKEIQQDVLEQVLPSAKEVGVEIKPVKQLHLTLHFIGIVDTAKISSILLKVEEVALSFTHKYGHKAFENYHSRITLDTLAHDGVIALILEEHPLLRVLHKDLLTIFAPDMPSEHHFIPHISLARLKENHKGLQVKLAETLTQISDTYSNRKICVNVEHLELVASEQGIHIPLAQFEI